MIQHTYTCTLSAMETDECVVCLDQVDPLSGIETCKTCQHKMHRDCLKRWHKTTYPKRKCPHCRSTWPLSEELQMMIRFHIYGVLLSVFIFLVFLILVSVGVCILFVCSMVNLATLFATVLTGLILFGVSLWPWRRPVNEAVMHQ